jgi:hypothetical protein
MLLNLISYPLAYRRLVSSVVETADAGARHPLGRRAADALVRAASQSSPVRAAAQFLVASIGRLTKHRFIGTAAIGLVIANALPTLYHWWPRLSPAPAEVPIALLALPIGGMLAVLIALRIAIAMPADLRANWVLDTIAPPPETLRAGAWRVMFALGTLTLTLLFAPLYWRAWGPHVAIVHMFVCLAVGTMLTEALLWGFAGMPCSHPWRPEHANIRVWWPLYLVAFFAITGGIPALEQLSMGSDTDIAWMIGWLLLIAVVLRVSHRRRRIMPEEDPDAPVSVQVLGLD